MDAWSNTPQDLFLSETQKGLSKKSYLLQPHHPIRINRIHQYEVLKINGPSAVFVIQHLHKIFTEFLTICLFLLSIFSFFFSIIGTFVWTWDCRGCGTILCPLEGIVGTSHKSFTRSRCLVGRIGGFGTIESRSSSYCRTYDMRRHEQRRKWWMWTQGGSIDTEKRKRHIYIVQSERYHHARIWWCNAWILQQNKVNNNKKQRKQSSKRRYK